MTGSPDQPVSAPSTGSSYPYRPGYPPAHAMSPPPVAPKNGLGIAALVLAVIGLLGVATVFVPVALGIAAVILGVIGRFRAKRGLADNGGVAVAGIVLGALAIVVGLAFIAIWTTVWRDVRGGDYLDCMQKAGADHVAQEHCADQFRDTIQDRLSVTLTPKSMP